VEIIFSLEVVMELGELSEREQNIWDTAHAVGFRDHAKLVEGQKPTTSTGSPEFSAESKEFIGKLFRSQIDLPPDIAEAVNEHFWELL
jgi:hypothetical protein